MSQAQGLAKELTSPSPGGDAESRQGDLLAEADGSHHPTLETTWAR